MTMMKRWTLALLACCAMLAATACEEKKGAAEPATEASATGAEQPVEASEDFGMIRVDALAGLSAKPGAVSIYDANGDSTRTKLGVIPEAELLTSYDGYDIAKLPKDKEKPLVFYCANEMCKASHEAAKRAAGAGHTNVSVLPDGIMGWKKAGKDTVQPEGLKRL